jgi:hypothetical protein
MHTNKNIIGVRKMINLFNKLPSTTHRVVIRTNPNVNAQIRNQTILNLNIYKNCSDEEKSKRISMLKFEWDTERVLETNAASIIFISSILGLKFSKCWFFVTGTVGFFLLQHALTGWCPPLPLIRMMGVRTAEEINNERTVLKMLRKDFTQNKKNNNNKNKIINVVDMLRMVEK